MVKLCWKKDSNGRTKEYFFDETDEMVYQICLEQFYSRSKLRLTLGGACLIGPCVTLSGRLFDDKYIPSNHLILIITVIFLVIGSVVISRSYESSEIRKYVYIKEHVIGEKMSNHSILDLYKSGMKERSGLLVLAILCGLIVWISTIMYQQEKNLTSIVVFYISFFSCVIWIKMLAPIKKYCAIRKIKQKK